MTATNAPAFFKLNAEYQIAPTATPTALLNDCSNLLGVAIGIMESKVRDTDTTTFGAIYMMRQALAAQQSAHAMLAKGVALA